MASGSNSTNKKRKLDDKKSHVSPAKSAFEASLVDAESLELSGKKDLMDLSDKCEK